MAFREGNTRRNTELWLLVLAALPVTLIYAMYVVNMQVELSVSALAVPLGLFAAFAVAHLAIRRLAPGADSAILPLVFLLSGIGIAFVTRLAPSLAVNQVIWLFLSVIAMIVTMVLVRNIDDLARYKYTLGLAGVILLVDAAEGPMPQTRFVLSRALELGHRVIVVVNKIDRPDQRIHEVVDEVLELLLDLDATPEQLDSPMLFCSGRNGTASYSPDEPGTDLKPLFDTILNYIPAPEADVDQPFQMLVSAIDYNEFVGRMAIGRIERGALKQNQEIMVCNYHNPDAAPKKAKAVSLYEFDGLGKKPVTESTAGNIICLSGIGDITIGDTICAPECVEALPFVKISAPTMEMTFSINDSPFAGRDGKFVTSRQLRERLFRETLKDVSLRVTEIEGAMDAFNVAGRGEMSLSILIETMRREGYEFQVSPPRVLYQTIDGKKCEPIERLVVDVPAESVGAVIEKIGSRKGDMVEMTPVGARMKVEFLVPARGLFGYRNEFLTDTKGEGIMASVFDSYAPYKGDLARRNTGSLVAFETGESITYGLFNAQERGQLFIGAGVPVYEGMVVGVSPKQEDITVNVCKKKQLTNMRASGSDDALRLVPPKQMSLEQCLEFLADDELLEVTPHALRIRKTILNHEKRMKATHGGKK